MGTRVLFEHYQTTKAEQMAKEQQQGSDTSCGIKYPHV